jgi:NitT/TauT family transport system substrate-binding protein
MVPVLSRLASIAVAIALATMPGGIAAQGSPAVRIAVLGNTDSASEPLYADAAGIFKKHGLDAKITEFTGGGAVVAAIAGGSIDVGFANVVSAAAAIQRGIPIVVLTPAALFTKKEPDVLLVKARGSSLKTAADLGGKTVAVTTLRGELQAGASAWIDKNGGDSKSVRFVELPSSEMGTALKQGRIDAAMLPEPALTLAKSDVEELGDAFEAIAPEFILGVFVASADWLQKNPDAARRFVAAMIETARWANGHRTETAGILAKHSRLPSETIRSMGRSLYGDSLSAALLLPPIDVAVKYGTLKQPLNASRLVAQAEPFWRGAKK